jgi:putative ABC transport system permease protein
VAFLGAAGLLLRRLRGERGVMLLVFLLVAGTSFVFAAGPRLFDRLSDDALRHAARTASPSQRNLAFRLDDNIAPGPAGGVTGVQAYGDELASDIPPSVSGLVVDRILQVTTVRFYVPDPPAYETHISLRYEDGLTDVTKLVAGRWPVAGAPLRMIPFGDEVPGEGEPTEPTGPVVVEAALSAASATEIGVRLGDRLGVTLDGSDPLLRGTAFRLAPTQIEIVGLYEPIDPAAERWAGNTALLQVEPHGTFDEPVAYATAYIPAEAYPGIRDTGLSFRFEWRFRVDPERFHADQVAQLQYDLPRLVRISSDAIQGRAPLIVLTGLPGIVDRYAAERALAESLLSIAAIGPFGLAAGAMAMVALLIVRRRRTALALARGRGASGSVLLGTQLWEAGLFAGAASLVGLGVAVAVVVAPANAVASALAVGVGAAAVVLLVGASWRIATRPLGQLERDDPPVLRVAPRRLVIEGTIVGIAVAATLLLRQRGLTIETADAAPRADPLLASVPVLAALAAGIVAVRLYPLPIRALGGLAARRRDLVPVLGLRTIGRHPAAANLPLLVLMLTAAFGAFASVLATSLDRGQAGASYLSVGADYRIEKTESGRPLPSLDAAAVPGVAAVAASVIETSTRFSSTPSQQGSIYMDAVEAEAYAAVVAGSAAEPRWPVAFLATPKGTDVGTESNPIPAILSTRLPAASANLAPGDTFRMTVVGEPLTFQLVERRETFPGIGVPTSFAIVPLEWVRAATPDEPAPIPTVLWVRASGDALDAVAAAIGSPVSARIVSRYDAYAVLHDAPLASGVVGGYALALIVAAMYMALTVVWALILSAARRTQDLAYLRTLGVTGAQALWLTVMEHAPPVIIAILPGALLGIGVAFLCEQGLALGTFVGTSSRVPVVVDWASIAVLLVGLVGVVAAAVAAGTWLSRRASLADALRIGEA